ncbi:hypothetical protein BXY66_2057 [Shimia isoporae]|uniref:Cell division protein FtsL n=1 Tax=Shimia isoporae TaxID=647720 RepID=A0A4R1NQ50_9RHOB|nr:cell division protein FtsL [Shimia isoporae]TCL09989.1 hypothetical protein BXY66_2057 [Shimia isoporae]
MRTIMFIVTVVGVICVSVWAYQENYSTQRMIKDTERLERQIGVAQARLAVLRAEWAYLNRPDRLRDLADINYNDLQLLPLRPDQFGIVEQVAYPIDESLLGIENATEVSADLDGERP